MYIIVHTLLTLTKPVCDGVFTIVTGVIEKDVLVGMMDTVLLTTLVPIDVGIGIWAVLLNAGSVVSIVH